MSGEWISMRSAKPFGHNHLLYLDDGVGVPSQIVGYWNGQAWIVNHQRVEYLPVTPLDEAAGTA